VLLLTVDTLRADYLSCNGYDRPTTPFVDSLLARGVHFTRAVTTMPRTTPALASLLTGCYPHTTKVRSLVDPLSPEVASVAQLARRAGYRTVAVVSNHVLSPARRLDAGFDVYDFADDARDAAATTQAALQRIGTLKPDDALLLWVHYIDPHVPYYPPPALAAQFDPGYAGRYPLHFGDVKGGVGDRAYPEDLPKIKAVFQNRLPDDVNAHIRRLYAADIRNTDDHIAQLVTALRARLGDDWLIVFTADHGESLGEHDYFYDHGDYVSNAELRVPLGFVFPPTDPMQRGGRVDAWVSLVDVMPTLVELLRLPSTAHGGAGVDGRSLVPYLRGESLPPRAVFAESGNSYFPQMVRKRVSFDVAGEFRAALLGDWKLIWTPGQDGDREFELYNVAVDPGETRNRYTPGDVDADRLHTLLRSWLKASDDRVHTVSTRDLEILRSLGYLR